MTAVTLKGMITHDMLVEAARRWLARSCSVVLTEIASSARETPDAIGWKDGLSSIVECKVSVSDFRHEAKKKRGLGVGRYRHYLVPRGLLERSALPPGWGLLEYDGRRVHQTVWPSLRQEWDMRDELLILMSCVRRIGQNSPPGISIKCYTIETQNRTTLTTR